MTDRPEHPATLAVPLPTFRPPRRLPLDELPGSSPSTSRPDEDSDPASPEQPPETTGDAPRPFPPIVSSPERPAGTRSRTSATSADPNAAGKAIAGVLVIVAGIAAGLLARAGRRLRQPTRRQVDEISVPLGKLAARHLPAGFLTDDLADITAAAAATHAYVLDDEDAPLITRTAAAAVDYPESE